VIRRTVPGHDLDDIDEGSGEPRRIVYHWPKVYDDPAERRIAPLPSDDAPNASPEQAAAPMRHDRPIVGVSASARRSDW